MGDIMVPSWLLYTVCFTKCRVKSWCAVWFLCEDKNRGPGLCNIFLYSHSSGQAQRPTSTISAFVNVRGETQTHLWESKTLCHSLINLSGCSLWPVFTLLWVKSYPRITGDLCTPGRQTANFTSTAVCSHTSRNVENEHLLRAKNIWEYLCDSSRWSSEVVWWEIPDRERMNIKGPTKD